MTCILCRIFFYLDGTYFVDNIFKSIGIAIGVAFKYFLFKYYLNTFSSI